MNTTRKPRKVKLILITSVIVLTAIALTVAGSLALKKEAIVPAATATTTTVTVAQWGQEKYLIYLPLYLAMEGGFFQKQGLKIDVKFTGNDDQTFAAVVSGNAQFGIGDPVFAAISQEKGYPARVIATVVGGVAIWGVTNDPKVPVIEKPEQLAGIKIGTFPSPSTNYTLMEELIKSLPAGIKKPTIVQAPIGSQLALLESHSAQIAMVLEPGASLAEHEGYRVVYSSPKFHGNYAFTGVTTTLDVLSAQPEMSKHFVMALEEAVVDAHKNPQIAIDVGRKLFPNLPADVVERAVNRMIKENTFPQHVLVDDEAWQRALATRLAVGDLIKPQETGITVDNSFAQQAMSANKQK